MHVRWWWLRLQLWQWANAWRLRPLRRTLTLLSWWVPAIVLPAVVALSGAHRAQAGLAWVLSFDMPMMLLLAAQVGSAIVALASRVDTEGWILPASVRGAAGKALFLTRLLHAMRWPLGLALASLLLWCGSRGSTEDLKELLLIACFALLGGASLAWLLLGRARDATASTRVPVSRARGWSALSWVPLHEVRRALDLRRLALLAVPLMLAAPMAAAAPQVLRGLVVWLVLLYCCNGLRYAARTAVAMHRWMPQQRLRSWRLHWYIWRYAMLAALLGVVALWLGWRLSAPQVVAAKP